MSKLVSLLKKQPDSLRSQVGTSSNGGDTSRPSPVQRKIHPNLNSLVAGFNDAQPVTLPKGNTSTGEDRSFDFEPLKPRRRDRPLSRSSQSQNVHGTVETKYLSGVYPETLHLESRDVNTPHIASVGLGAGIRQSASKGATTSNQQSLNHIPPSSPGGAWSTFGRTGKPIQHTNLEDIVKLPDEGKTYDCPINTLQSDNKIPLGTPTNRSGISSSSVWSIQQVIQTDTPNTYTPSPSNTVSTSPAAESRSSPLSYHTFGSRKVSSPYIFRETPPPMPALDHPAFQSVRSTTRNQHQFISSHIADERKELQKVPRHSVSLPALQSHETEERCAQRTPKSTRSARKKCHTDKKEINQSEKWKPGSGRLRTCSKGSQSSRRSSAEYSSRNATDASNTDENWEAEVSKQIVEMALRVKDRKRGKSKHIPKKESDITILGPTRVFNVLKGGARGLGSPFLLQDTPSNQLVPQLGWHEDESNSALYHNITRSGVENIREMTQPFAPTNHQNDKGKARELYHSANQDDTAKGQDKNTQSASSIFLLPPSFSLTSPTPESSPISPLHAIPSSLDQLPVSSTSKTVVPSSALKSSLSRATGKRKADEVEGGTPPKERKEQRATFAPEQRPHRVSENSGSSHAPSSYRRKRARLSLSSESRPLSRTPTINSAMEHPGTEGSRTPSVRERSKAQTPSLHHHHASRQSMSSHRASARSPRPHREPSRRSLSQASIPISALIFPHAPSVSRSLNFHMHDPRKPGPVKSTPWVPVFPSQNAPGQSRWNIGGWIERGGSPIHAWLFFLGFLVFPIWWMAAFLGIPRTRRIGESGVEKGVVLDDPQVEHDSKSWRMRCRVMAVISFFTYIPFIILVAVFAPR